MKASEGTTRQWLLETVLVFAVFSVHGPRLAPDENETFHFSKIAHFWNPSIFPNDFHASTPNAHQLFYALFGWLTLALSWDTTAWLGRALSWLFLAGTWTRLSRAMLPQPWVSVLAATLMLSILDQSQMAMESIVVGFEAKVIAYGFLFLALEGLASGRWNQTWLALGAATSIHVLVGGWATFGVALVWAARRQGPEVKTMRLGLLGWLLLAAPGLAVAVQQNAVLGSVAEASAGSPMEILVYERRPHHLLFLTFPLARILSHTLACVGFWVLCRFTPARRPERDLRWFVTYSIFLAVVGAALGCLTAVADLRPAACWLLRFYWFRLSDTMVPVGLSLVTCQFIFRVLLLDRARHRSWDVGLVLVSLLIWSGGHSLARKLTNPEYAGVPWDALDHQWRDACRWAREHTEVGTVFITPRYCSTFKWFANRDEVITWKDCTEDASTISVWWRRMNDVFASPGSRPAQRWYRTLAEAPPEHLLRSARSYGAQYLIVEVPEAGLLVPPPPLRLVYRNDRYAIFSSGP